jgi:hypothetical protein
MMCCIALRAPGHASVGFRTSCVKNGSERRKQAKSSGKMMDGASRPERIVT